MTKKFPLTNWSEKKAFTIKLGAVKKYHIAVFADPNCPWCKRFFEENTDKLNDLEIFVYLAPVLGEDSEKLAAEPPECSGGSAAFFEREGKIMLFRGAAGRRSSSRSRRRR